MLQWMILLSTLDLSVMMTAGLICWIQAVNMSQNTIICNLVVSNRDDELYLYYVTAVQIR